MIRLVADDYYDEDGRRHLRAPLVIGLAIVLLRLAVGWHFYREGAKKLEVDPATGKVRVAFAGTEGFLRGAVGPIAELARDQLPGFHDWQEVLIVPEQFRPPTSEQVQQRATWTREYEAERKAVQDKNKTLKEIGEPAKPIPVEFPPDAPYHDLAERIASDWLEVQADYVDINGLEDAQKAAAADAYQSHKQFLAEYLLTVEDEMVAWRHELWRLEQWKSQGGAEDIPFKEERIAEQSAETSRTPLPWIAQLRSIESSYFDELREIAATNEAEEEEEVVERVDSLLADKKAQRLRYADIAVTCLIIGVGACLMLGLFTRLASFCGAAFLLTVMATQPPWIEGARIDFFYYQLVELAALVVLFTTKAGRFAGLDFLIHALFSKRGERD